MNKEIKEPVAIPKTLWERAEESFLSALMAAGMLAVTILVLWLPFKIIPAIFGYGSNFVSTTLSSLFIEDTTGGNLATQKEADKTSDKSVTTNAAVKIKKAYYGKSDLEVTLVSTGIIDPASKQFMQTNYAGFNDEIAIKFEVKNVGTNVSGEWKLRINSPSRTTPYYDSEYQASIKPGDRIAFTTSFDSPSNTGVNTAYITADPLNMIDENSESNNQITVPIKIDGLTYNYTNNYNYGNTTVVQNPAYGTSYAWTSTSLDCSANPQTSYLGSPVTWYATVSGGNGYYSYKWSGSDDLYSNMNTVSKSYFSSGTKTATVTVNSNGTILSKTCSVYIY